MTEAKLTKEIMNNQPNGKVLRQNWLTRYIFKDDAKRIDKYYIDESFGEC